MDGVRVGGLDDSAAVEPADRTVAGAIRHAFAAGRPVRLRP